MTSTVAEHRRPPSSRIDESVAAPGRRIAAVSVTEPRVPERSGRSRAI